MKAEYSRLLALAFNSKKSLQLSISEREELKAELIQFDEVSEVPEKLREKLMDLVGDNKKRSN